MNILKEMKFDERMHFILRSFLYAKFIHEPVVDKDDWTYYQLSRIITDPQAIIYNKEVRTCLWNSMLLDFLDDMIPKQLDDVSLNQLIVGEDIRIEIVDDIDVIITVTIPYRIANILRHHGNR